MALTLYRSVRLDAGDQQAVRMLATTVQERDGQPPLSDQALMQLGAAHLRHLLARDGTRVVGYAQIDTADTPVAEIASDPEALTLLLTAVAADVPAGLRIWSHGTSSPLAAALAERDFTPTRTLHQLRRELREPIAAVPAPDGVTIRSFVVGSDEAQWLRVNAAAFAHHDEQGRWTLADLQAREREAWFDPAGLLIAERDAAQLGFHWTKVHDSGIGEVYVLGVDPAAQGLGLGAVLLTFGLRHLQHVGCPDVLLYVDDSNTGALSLYERHGFNRFDRDVQWLAG
ncbi:MAG: mycothiol synthase [Jatrophihabitantaceae bacterium]